MGADFTLLTMVDYADLSRKMVQILGLRNEPVGIKLIKKGEPFPEGYDQPEKPIRHCQSIMRARKGECVLMPVEKHACHVGASALGLVPTPEKVSSGHFHFALGMYADEEAAKKTIDSRPTLEPESVSATLTCPLSKVLYDPDVIVVVGTPEQLYWLMPAASTYERGGRVSMQIASFQASCVDSTVIPYITGEPNLSLGCYGCRRTTDIAPEEMLLGIKADGLERLVTILDKMQEKAIPYCRSGSAK